MSTLPPYPGPHHDSTNWKLKTYILNILKSNVEHKWLGKKQLKFNFIWFRKRVKGALIMLQDFIVAGKLYERRTLYKQQDCV